MQTNSTNQPNARHTVCHAGALPRKMGSLALLMVLFCCTGATCSRSLRNPFATPGPPAPEVLVPGASLEQVTAAVNQNTSRIASYSTNNASISVPGMPAIPLLRGNIAAQRPRRFRLQASTALTGPEVDLGSGDEVFWFWVRRNQPPALYFSRHDQFVGSAAQQVMPVQPQWFLSALGLVEFKASDFHEGPLPHGNGTLEIRSVMQTATGTLTKSTVIDARRAWVLQQYLYDSTGKLLASAVARSHRYYPEYGVSLPQQIDIRLPPAQLALSINVGTLQLNQLADSPLLWSIPAMSGYPQVDLGSATSGMPLSNAASTGATFPMAALADSPLQNRPAMGPVPPIAPVGIYQSGVYRPNAGSFLPVTGQLPPGGLSAR